MTIGSAGLGPTPPEDHVMAAIDIDSELVGAAHEALK
jgi:hypothetical protein